nr:MtnX-like HAD-IB family phosphatase [uncultured Rhodoferax sp.]
MNKVIPLHRLVGNGPNPRTEWVVQSDFDGTISLHDVTDSLLQRFGRPGWQALEEAWEAGAIGSRECLTQQIALLDMDTTELDSHLDHVAIDPHFVNFVHMAQRQGVDVQVISDGLDYAIRRTLQTHGLGDLSVVANRLVSTGPRSWKLETPHTHAACPRASGNCKCERLREQKAMHGKVLYIGDGSSDFCVSAKADYVLAKDRLQVHCQQHGIPHATFGDFFDASVHLMMLITSNPRTKLA